MVFVVQVLRLHPNICSLFPSNSASQHVFCHVNSSELTSCALLFGLSLASDLTPLRGAPESASVEGAKATKRNSKKRKEKPTESQPPSKLRRSQRGTSRIQSHSQTQTQMTESVSVDPDSFIDTYFLVKGLKVCSGVCRSASACSAGGEGGGR